MRAGSVARPGRRWSEQHGPLERFVSGRADACYNSVVVSGAEATSQASRMGVYTKVPGLMQGDRPVYKAVGSTVAYLFYWPSAGDSYWRIGSDYASSVSGVKSTSNGGALCPDEATPWKVYNGGGWNSIDSYAILVVPADGNLPTATPTLPPTSSTKPPTLVPTTSVGNVLPPRPPATYASHRCLTLSRMRHAREGAQR